MNATYYDSRPIGGLESWFAFILNQNSVKPCLNNRIQLTHLTTDGILSGLDAQHWYQADTLNHASMVPLVYEQMLSTDGYLCPSWLVKFYLSWKVEKTAVRSSRTSRFYAWASDFISPLARESSSALTLSMKWKRKGIKILNHSINEAGQVEECLRHVGREVFLANV